MQVTNLTKDKIGQGNNVPTTQTIDMDEVVTRRILAEEFAKFEDRFEEKLDAKLDAKLDSKLDTKLSQQRKEYERYMGALAEDFQSKLDAITEVVVATAEDMTSLKNWIKEDHYNVHMRIDSRLNVLEASGSSMVV